MAGIKSTVRKILKDSSQLILIAVWFGLLFGIFEGVAKVIVRELPRRTITVPVEILWVAPLFNLILFIGISLCVEILFRLIGKKTNYRMLVGLLVSITFFGILLFLGKINQFAALFLSIGLGLEFARRLKNKEDSLIKFFKSSIGVLGGITIVLVIIGISWNGLQERYLVNKIPEPRSFSPNILLITIDTLRADHLSSLGYERQTTPNLDQIAQEGILFENAFANSSWTLPAHASMFTGRLPNEHKADWENPLDNTFPVLAEELMENGYITAAFSANTEYVTPEWGLGRGFTHFEVYGSSWPDYIVRTIYGKKLALNILPRIGYYDIPGRKRAERVNKELLEWLDVVDRRPFFAYLNYMDVHDPYITVEPYRTNFSDDVTNGEFINYQLQIPFRRKPELSLEEIQREINGYDGALSYIDANIGNLFTELSKRGILEDSLVIITSDHGEAFGNHDLYGHGNSLYIETLHVPLIVYWKNNIPSGMRINNLIGLNQLPVTIMELINFNESRLFPGESISELWDGDGINEGVESIFVELSPGRFENGPQHYPVASGELGSVITDEWHFILFESGQFELFEWRSDRQELNNMSGSSQSRELVEYFKSQLQKLQ